MDIILNGALGKMGRMVMDACKVKGDRVVAMIERKGHPQILSMVETHWGSLKLLDDARDVQVHADAGIDFSSPDGAVEFCEAMASLGIPVVSGTTGLSKAHFERMMLASQKVAILWTPNASFGVFCLREVVSLLATILPADYDCEIVEVHHKHKKDAPSGTAMMLAEVVANERGVKVRTGRDATMDQRGGDVFVHALRGGEVVGEHIVLFLGETDSIEVKHTALSRQAFAIGALELARKIVQKPAGFYTIKDLFPGIVR
jgi:4-hydroxy-tetrahydrodipicolinate reductase